jgi:hypothetical protein
MKVSTLAMLTTYIRSLLIAQVRSLSKFHMTYYKKKENCVKLTHAITHEIINISQVSLSQT